ncbi:MAG: 30S ribosomal protein S20 [Candidatus Onthovivens sp.]|nr:30S ribosomal protein S20 [Mollicutes bacterium]MDD6468579.1 30S ribosomal protein S20 [Bacilli bacterium]MDY2724702.1 30S ribosomal protein S20 [Candidatus Onthovivens sp.]MCI6615369.1 30S ribosomal protein S20 [Mollicutes bacterium]MCI7039598.1 30S ribosomal protein S20 [Mollicutes bacterium]
MANIKQQKKRILTNEKSRVRNISYKSKVRTAIKAVRVAVEKKDLELANTKLVLAFSVIDRSVSKGIQKKGTADRQKSNIQNLVNSLKK